MDNIDALRFAIDMDPSGMVRGANITTKAMKQVEQVGSRTMRNLINQGERYAQHSDKQLASRTKFIESLKRAYARLHNITTDAILADEKHATGFMRYQRQMENALRQNIAEAGKYGKAIQDAGLQVRKLGRNISEIGKSGINIAPLKKQLKELRDSMATGTTRAELQYNIKLLNEGIDKARHLAKIQSQKGGASDARSKALEPVQINERDLRRRIQNIIDPATHNKLSKQMDDILNVPANASAKTIRTMIYTLRSELRMVEGDAKRVQAEINAATKFSQSKERSTTKAQVDQIKYGGVNSSGLTVADVQNRIKGLKQVLDHEARIHEQNVSLVQDQKELIKLDKQYENTKQKLLADIGEQKELERELLGIEQEKIALARTLNNLRTSAMRYDETARKPISASEVKDYKAKLKAKHAEMRALDQEYLTRIESDPGNRKQLEAEHARFMKEKQEEARIIKDVLDVQNNAFQTQRKRLYDIQNTAQTVQYTFGALGASITAMAMSFSKAFLEIETKLNLFKSVTFEASDSIGEIDRRGDVFVTKVMDMAKSSKFAASEMIEVASSMGKMGLNAKQVSDSLGTIVTAAQATGESLDKVASTVISVANQFNIALNAENILKVTDILSLTANKSATSFEGIGEAFKYVAPMANAMGESLEETAGWLAFLSNRGIDGTVAATALGNILERIAANAPETQKALKALGVTAIDPLTKKTRSMKEIFIDLAASMKDMSGGQITGIGKKLFGERSMKAFAAAITEINEDGIEAFSKTIEQATKDADGFTKKVESISFRGFETEVKALAHSFDELKFELGESFAEALTPVMKTIKDLIQAIAAAPKPVKDMISNLSLWAIGLSAVAVAAAGLIQVLSSLKLGLLTLSGLLTGASWASLLNPFVLAALALTGVIVGLGFAIKLNGDQWKEYKRQIDENEATDLRYQQTKKDTIELLQKEKDGVQLLAEEYKKLAGAQSAKRASLVNAKNSIQEIMDFLEDPDRAQDMSPAAQQMFAEHQGMDVFAYNSKFKKGSQERIDILKAYAISFDEHKNEIKKTADEIKDLQSKGDEATNRESILKTLEDSKAKILELVRSYQNAETAAGRLKIKADLTKENENYIAALEKARGLTGDQVLTQEELVAQYEDSLLIEREMAELGNENKLINKDLLTLINMQNDARRQAIDLLQAEKDLQMEIKLGQAIGADTSFTQGKSGLTIDANKAIDAQKRLDELKKQKEKDDKETSRQTEKAETGQLGITAKTVEVEFSGGNAFDSGDRSVSYLPNYSQSQQQGVTPVSYAQTKAKQKAVQKQHMSTRKQVVQQPTQKVVKQQQQTSAQRSAAYTTWLANETRRLSGGKINFGNDRAAAKEYVTMMNKIKKSGVPLGDVKTKGGSAQANTAAYLRAYTDQIARQQYIKQERAKYIDPKTGDFYSESYEERQAKKAQGMSGNKDFKDTMDYFEYALNYNAYLKQGFNEQDAESMASKQYDAAKQNVVSTDAAFYQKWLQVPEEYAIRMAKGEDPEKVLNEVKKISQENQVPLPALPSKGSAQYKQITQRQQKSAERINYINATEQVGKMTEVAALERKKTLGQRESDLAQFGIDEQAVDSAYADMLDKKVMYDNAVGDADIIARKKEFDAAQIHYNQMLLKYQQLRNKLREEDIKRAYDIQKFNDQQLQMELQLNEEKASLSESQLDDEQARLNSQLKSLEIERQAKYDEAAKIFLDDEKLNEENLEITEQYARKKEYLEAASAQRLFEMRVDKNKKLFDMEMQYQEMQDSLLPESIEKTTRSIERKYKAERKALDDQISIIANKSKTFQNLLAKEMQAKAKKNKGAAGLGIGLAATGLLMGGTVKSPEQIALEKQKDLLNEIELEEIRLAQFESSQAALEGLNRKIELTMELNAVTKDILELQTLLSEPIDNSNITQAISELRDYQKAMMPQATFADMRKVFESTQGEREKGIKNLREGLQSELDLTIKRLEKDKASVDTNLRVIELRERLFDLDRQLLAIQEERALLGDKEAESYINAYNMLGMLKDRFSDINTVLGSIDGFMKNAFDIDTNGSLGAIGEQANKLIGLAQKFNQFTGVDSNRDFMKNIANAASDFGESFFPEMFGTRDSVNAEKIYNKDGQLTNTNLSAGGGTAGKKQIKTLGAAGANLAAALTGNPAAIAGLVAMAPDIIDMIGNLANSFSGKEMEQFKVKSVDELNSILDERDKILHERGDMSTALFNERNLQRVAENYKNKAKQLTFDTEKAINDAFWSEAAGMGINLLSPIGMLLGGGDPTGAFKRFSEKEGLIKATKAEKDKLLAEQEKQAGYDATAEGYMRQYQDQSAGKRSGIAMRSISAALSGNEFDQALVESEQKRLDIEDKVAEAGRKYLSAGGIFNSVAAEEFAKETERLNKELEFAEKQTTDTLRDVLTSREGLRRDNLIQEAQLNKNISEFAKQRISIEETYAQKEREIQDEIDKTKDPTGELAKKKNLIRAEGLKALADNAKDALRAVQDIQMSLNTSAAELTSGEADNAVAALDKQLTDIERNAEDMRERFAGNPKAIEAINQQARNESLLAIRTHNDAIISEQIELAKREGDIQTRSLEMRGKTAKAIQQESLVAAQTVIDNLEKTKILYGKNSREFILQKKETELDLYDIAKAAFDKQVDLYQQDLDTYIEIQTLKAEIAQDPALLAKAGVQGELQRLALERMVVNNEPASDSRTRKLELIAAKEQKARLDGVKEIGNAELEKLEQIRTLRQEIYDDQIKVFEGDIKDMQREVNDLQRQVNEWQRRKNEIQRDIDAKQRLFNKEDKQKFQDELAGKSLKDELFGALEYVSNPLLNRPLDSDPISNSALMGISAQSALEAAKAQAAATEAKIETDFALEDITASQYAEQMSESAIQRALFGKAVLAELGAQQQAEIQRLTAQGITTDELRVIEKHQWEEKQAALEFYAQAYKDWQQYQLQGIEAVNQAELEGLDESIANNQAAIDVKKDQIEVWQDQIDNLTDELDADMDILDEAARGIERSIRGWGYSLDDVRNKFTDLVKGVVDEFASVSTAINNMKVVELPFDFSASVKDTLAKINGLGATLFNGLAGSDYKPPKTSIPTTGVSSGSGAVPQTNADLARTRPSSRSSGKGEHIYNSAVTGRWYDSRDKMLLDESIYRKLYGDKPATATSSVPTGMSSSLQSALTSQGFLDSLNIAGITGYAQGGMAYTGQGVGGGDYILAALRNREIVAPERDFKSFASDMLYDNHLSRTHMYNGGGGMGDQNISFTFGNVYGVDDLEGKIQGAIRQANKRAGFYNASYTVDSF